MVAFLIWCVVPLVRAEVDRGVIRLAPRQAPVEPESPGVSETAPLGASRHGFDVTAFDSRFESLWFQRKLFQADGRDDEAARQSDSIRGFVIEEGVRRLDVAAGSLLIESRRWLREGSHEKALAALALAESLDPGRPQITLARAHVLWSSGAGPLAAGAEWLKAMRGSVKAAVRELNFVHGSALIVLAALLGAVALFSLLMVFRYQSALRHDVEDVGWEAGREGVMQANPTYAGDVGKGS